MPVLLGEGPGDRRQALRQQRQAAKRCAGCGEPHRGNMTQHLEGCSQADRVVPAVVLAPIERKVEQIPQPLPGRIGA